MKYLSMLVVLAIATISLPVQSVSFDCTKAVTNVEHMICETPNLSRFDSEMAQLYRQHRRIDPAVKKEQRAWLKYTRNKCENIDCLTAVYQSRIYALDRRSVDDTGPRSDNRPTIAAAKSTPTLNSTDKAKLLRTKSDFISKWPSLTSAEKIEHCYKLPEMERTAVLMEFKLIEMDQLRAQLNTVEREYFVSSGMDEKLRTMGVMLTQQRKLLPFLQTECDRL